MGPFSILGLAYLGFTEALAVPVFQVLSPGSPRLLGRTYLLRKFESRSFRHASLSPEFLDAISLPFWGWHRGPNLIKDSEGQESLREQDVRE